MVNLSDNFSQEEEPSPFIDEIDNVNAIDPAVEDEFGRKLTLLEWKPIRLSKLTREARESCYELFRRGDISWFLHPEQMKLLNWIEAKHREISTICMSRQWGKTTLLLSYCIAYCIKHPKCSVLFIAPHRIQVENTMLPKINTVFQFLPDDLLPARRGLSWTFPNGSMLRLDGIAINQGTRIRGDSVHLCVIDECRDVPDLQGTIESVVSPMFATTDGRLVLISTPPESPLHAFTKKYIYEAIASDNFYSATYKLNPLLSTKRLRYLLNVQYKGGEENIVFRREYMADWSQTDPDKRVVREWDVQTNDAFFVDYKLPEIARGYVGMDFAFNDPCGIIIGFYDFEAGCLVIEEEFFERGKNSDEVGEAILEMEKRLRERMPKVLQPIRVMDIDPSLMSDLNARFGLRFEPAYKVPSALAMLNRLRISFNTGKIRVRDTCPQLRFQLAAGVFNASGSDYLRTQTGGHLDLIDALKYLNLNTRWHENVMGTAKDEVGQGQMRIGGFAQPSTFRDGIIQRPH